MEFIELNDYDMNFDLDLKFSALDDSFSPLDDAAKCGDIFLLDDGKFAFSCYFCIGRFTGFDNFTNHISEEHLKLVSAKHNDAFQRKKSAEAEPVLTQDFVLYHDACLPVAAADDSKSLLCDIGSVAKLEEAVTECQNVVEKPQQKKEYPCGFCGRVLYSMLGLTMHEKHHMKTANNSNAKDSSAPETPPVTATGKTLKCQYCEKHFKTPFDLKGHERIHTGEKPFKCAICSKCFRVNRQLRDHSYTHSTSAERPHKCPHCPAAFASNTNLQNHIKTHLGVKRYKCDYCDKKFITPTERKIHTRRHTGEKPFQCGDCEMAFNTGSLLTLHRNAVHTKEKTFTCEFCQKEFFKASALKAHLVSHSTERPFECTICSATFPRQLALKIHTKLHSSIKEYSCKVCGKEFAQNSSLYSHMKTHNST